MNEVIRRAEIADATQLAELEAAARHHLIEQRGATALIDEMVSRSRFQFAELGSVSNLRLTDHLVHAKSVATVS